MSMGQAFRKILSVEQRRALRQACDMLLDELLDELPRADAQRTNLDLEEFSIELLPPQYQARYTERFGRRFLACLMTVAWKLNQPHFVKFACVAEELAAWAILRRAEALLEVDGLPSNLSRLETVLFEDTDFKMLFDPFMDGVDESELGKVMGMTSLRFEDWFTPFDLEAKLGEVHPFAEEDSIS